MLENPIGQGRSELHVQFKRNDGSPDATYVYYFNTPGAGAEIARKLADTDHPYSQVVYPLLVKNTSINYTKIANR